MANFNFSGQPEYDLNTTLTSEMINLYGILVKFLLVEKINQDPTVFGDYSHLKSDKSKIYDIYMLPENSEDWDNNGYEFNPFGINNFDNINLFAMKSNFEQFYLDEPSEIVGNLVMLPNNKILEITHMELSVPGINNLYTQNDDKSVYKFTCRPYEFKTINELDSVDISATPGVPNDTLDIYFQELIDDAMEQDEETEVTPSVDTVDKTEGLDDIVQKPIVDKTEDQVWGDF